MVLSLGVAIIVIGTDASVLVPAHTVGALFGTLESVENAGGIVGPLLGGALYALFNKEDDGNIDSSHVTAPLIAVACCYGVVLTMLYFGYERFVMQGRYNNKKDDAYISNMNDDMRTSVESTPAVRVSSKIV
jgi:MFS family permease